MTSLHNHTSPLIARIWSAISASASRLYGAAPTPIKRVVDESVEQLPLGPARHPDSGDHVSRTSFLDISTVSNAIRRYVGAPEMRAAAWEELGIFLQRWGWRMSDLAYEQAYDIRDIHDLNQQFQSIHVFETDHFRLVAPGKPLIDRRDGGHLTVYPLIKVLDRMHFSPEQIREFTPFCLAVGRAFQEVMNESGIPVIRLNWMDMGNWRLVPYDDPRFHLHIFGRARGSRFQIHGEFNQIPPKGSRHYDMIKPLNGAEIAKLKERLPRYFVEEMERLTA